MSITLTSQMNSVFEYGIKVMQKHEEPIIQEWENILLHLKKTKERSFNEMEEAIGYFKNLIFKTNIHEKDSEDSSQQKSFPSSDQLFISFEIHQSFLILLENVVHTIIQTDPKHAQKDHQAIQYVFDKIGAGILTNPHQNFTIETFLQELVSSNQFPVQWAALVNNNGTHYHVKRLVNQEDTYVINNVLKADSIFGLSEMLLSEMDKEQRKKFNVLPISYHDSTLLFCINSMETSNFVPFITYSLRIFQQGQDTLALSRQEQDWRDSVILFNEMIMRSRSYQEAIENITAGFVNYLPFERSALFSYTLNDDAGIGMHAQGLDNEIIQNIAENINNLPIIQKNLNFLQLYGKNMKYFQPIYIKEASAGFPNRYVQQFQLGSLVVAPIFTTVDNKLLGAVLLDQGPNKKFQLNQETVTALARFGQSAGEILSKFTSHNSEQKTLALQLSPREIDVLQLMAKGASTHQAASELHLSEYTVRDYVSAIMQKMDAQNRTEAVARAIRENII